MSLWGNKGGQNLVGNTYTNTTLTVTSTAGIAVGTAVFGNNVAKGNTVTAVVNTTAFTISSAAAGTSNGTYTFYTPPKNKHALVSTSKANGAVAYGNNIVRAENLNEAVGLFAANTLMVEQSNGGGSNPNAPSGGNRTTSPGWIKVTQYTGPVTALNVGNATVTGFANLASFQVTNSTGNAVVANIHIASTNATGGSLTFAIDNPGSQFINTGSVAIVGGANSLVLANIATPGVGYATTDAFVFSNGLINAVARPVVNSMGAVTGLTFLIGGAGFDGVAADVKTNYVAGGLAGPGIPGIGGTGNAANGISSATVVAGTSLSFTNGDFAVFTSTTNSLAVPAKFTLGTNATGGITSANAAVCGSGFDGNTSHVTTAFTNSTGGTTAGVIGTGSVTANAFNGINAVIAANSTSFGGTAAGNAVLTVTLGGRAGRVHFETLAELGSISTPNAPAYPYS